MNFSKIKENKGFSMIELMASIVILSFGIIVIYNIFSNFIVLTNTISSRLTAIYLAKEGIEITRNIRDNNILNNKNWDKDLTGCSGGCQADYKAGTALEASTNSFKNYNNNNFLQINSDGFYSYDLGNPSKFKRKIIITIINSNVAKVDAQVFWDYNGKSLSFEVIDYLYH